MTARRRRFGRVRQLPSGRWQARYPGPDGQQRTAPQTFERKRDAEQFLSEIETDLLRGDWFDPLAGRTPLAEYAATWIEERGLAVRTEELYRSLLRNHIKPYLGGVPVADLTPPAIRVGARHCGMAVRRPGRSRRRTACCTRSW